MPLDCVSVEMTGCMVLGSPVAPTTTRPPATGVSEAAAVAEGPLDAVGVVPDVQAVATSIATPKTAKSRLTCPLPPCALPRSVAHDTPGIRLRRQSGSVGAGD